MTRWTLKIRKPESREVVNVSVVGGTEDQARGKALRAYPGGTVLKCIKQKQNSDYKPPKPKRPPTAQEKITSLMESRPMVTNSDISTLCRIEEATVRAATNKMLREGLITAEKVKGISIYTRK